MSASNSVMFQRQLLIILTALRPRRRRGIVCLKAAKTQNFGYPNKSCYIPSGWG
jgi:hypothetical protein